MCKIILVGNDAVGKTSIISKYYNEMDENYNYSITKEKIKTKVEIKNKIIELDIWDTVGQEKYRSVNKIFMKSTEIALLISYINFIIKNIYISLIEYFLNCVQF